ncbi:MAG TPA: hypothetical protein EYG21_00240 [Nitrospinaceae bacterium]|jgi:hypothetical protein|nr:hypothetical protein [Nitrospinaceae bacterium]
MSSNIKDLSKKLSKYEWGRMDDKEFFSFFQELIDSGTLPKLQGHYGRVAQSLIEEGVCCEN